MSFETDLSTNYQTIRQRLWGKTEPKPPRIPAPPDVIHIIDMDTLTAKAAEERLPGPKKPTRRQVQDILEDEDAEWQSAVKAILKSYGENMRRLTSNQRDTHIASCRKDVAKYLFQTRGWSTPRIGRFMNRDHSSILNMLDPEVRRDKYRRQRELTDKMWSKIDEAK